MKKVLFLLWLLPFCSGQLQAQVSRDSTSTESRGIEGRLLDPRGKPLSFANVTLLKAADSTLVAAGMTDSLGRYRLALPAPGRYTLRFSAIGFGEQGSEVFNINNREPLVLADRVMKNEARAMEEVSVTAMRPTIVQKADRMVVTIEGTAMAAGNTAYSVLAKAPGVFIDQEGNIQLNGRSGVTVMIDGKLTYLSATDLRNMLEGMSAENIKNIEIITNPSARYDAEGTSGILNINLKKNQFTGINGSVYAGYSFNGKQHGFNSGGNINYLSGKWNTFLSLDMARRVGGREATFTRVFYGPQKTTYFDQVATGNFTVFGPPAVRVGSDYTISAKHSVGAVVNYTTNMAHSDFLTQTYIGTARSQPTDFIKADNFSSNRYKNFTTNLHYVGKYDTLGKSFTADLDMARIRNRGESDFFNYFTDLTNQQQTKDFLYTFTPNGYDVYAARLDLTLPYSNGQKWEMGLKGSRVVSDNDSRFYFNNGAPVLDSQRTNHFRFREHIYAAYLNWMGNFSSRVSFQAGLRAEQTRSTGTSLTTGEVNRRSYLDLFPSLFLQQKVSDGYEVSYSYSRRLTRPNYGSLNPFRFYRDPYTWIVGNPKLRPQYTNSFSITQTFKKTYNLILSYQRTSDVIAELPLLNVQDNTTVYYNGNVDDSHSWSATAMVPFKIMKKWDSQNTLQTSYSRFSMQDQNGHLVNKQLFYMIQSNHTILLPLQLRMEMNLLFRGPAASGLYRISPMNRVDLALKRSFLNKKVDLTVNATDIFKNYWYHFTTDIAGNVNEFDQYFRIRTLGVNLRYNFSKGKKGEEKRKTSGPEELNRI